MKRRQINKINQAYFRFSKKKELMQSSKTTKKRINAIFKNEKKAFPRTQGFCPKPED